MHKKVKQYAQRKGMTVNEKAGLVYGRINGFFLVINIVVFFKLVLPKYKEGFKN